MDMLRIALAQLNVTVGALRQNRVRMLEAARKAEAAGADLIVYPELALCGYPPEDLVLKPHFVAAMEAELNALAADFPPELTGVAGTVTAGDTRPGNAAAVLSNGSCVGIYRKRELPNYGVFDERRIFAPGEHPLCLDLRGHRIGIQICEDSWIHETEDLRTYAACNLSVLLNLSASPFHQGKFPQRLSILQSTATAVNAPLAYCNLVGGQDELVFDGGSMLIHPDGTAPLQARRFEEDLLIFDLPPRTADVQELPSRVDRIPLPALEPRNRPPLAEHPATPPLERLDEIYQALCMGLRDYADKNGFRQALIAISGGIDSALVAAIAVDALGADRVKGVSLPTKYSSEGTRNDAVLLAERLGIEMPMLPIQGLVDEFLSVLEPQWPGREADVTEENLQSRIRGTLVMALSNKFGTLVVATGNKSEMATGYATLYGDMCGGYALIKDVPKSTVFDLCRWRNEQAGTDWIPQTLIDRPPSAELREDQKDSDSLPPYEILDAILTKYIEQDLGRDEIVADGFDPETVTRVIRLVDGNEYKRRQAPPGVKITPKAFGRDRRVPITNHFRPIPAQETS
jgi:NAD+ synthase (glutamine-hydrolysing)